MAKSNDSNGGMGFAEVLTLVFVVLKLTGVISWSWWWVLSPIWIVTLLVAVFALIGAIVRIHNVKNNSSRKR